MQASLVLAFAAIGRALEFSDIRLVVPDEFVPEDSPSVQFSPALNYDVTYDDSLWSTRATSPRFTYSTKDGSARAGSDYVTTSGTFTFPHSGFGFAETITIPVMNDNIAEPSSEYFELELSVDTSQDANFGQINLPARNPTATINDDEGLSIELISASAIEGIDTKFDFTVVLSHQTADDFPFKYTTVGSQSARRGVDFVGASQVDLIFAAGTQTKTFDIAILDDAIQENIETFEVFVEYTNNADGYIFNWVGYESSGQRALGKFNAENEGVTVCISNQVMAEGASNSMDFTVSLSHLVEAEVPLSMRTTAGSSAGINHAAEASTHYLDAQADLRFPSRSTDDIHFSVPVINDNVQSAHSSSTPDAFYGPVNFAVEYTVDHAVYAGSVGGADNAWNVRPCGSTSNVGTATGEIYDFEDVTISLTGSTSSLVEESTTAFQYTVALSHKVVASTASNSPARGASFVWVDNNLAREGTASVEVNTPSAGCSSLPNFGNSEMPSTGPVDLCWPQGINPMNLNNGKSQNVIATTQLFDASPNGAPTDFFANFAHGPIDYFIEGTETFRVGIMLDQSASAGYNIRYADGTTIENGVAFLDGTIVDNEPTSPFVFTTLNPSVQEGIGSQFTFSVALTHSVAHEVGLSWSTTDGSAGASTDFAGSSNSKLTWPANSEPNAYRTVDIAILNDNIQELSETFTVTFSDATPSILFATISNVQTATILDNEGTTISIADMASAKDESELNWDFDVTLSHETDHDVSVAYAAAVDTLSGIAAAASRFDTSSNTLVFPTRQQNAVASINVVNDNIQTGITGSVQLFNVVLNLASASSISSTGSKLSATARISDSEGVEVSISPSFAQEEDGTAQFIVSLSHAVTTDVSVLYNSNETACTTGATACALGSSLDLSILLGENDYQSTGSSNQVTIIAGTQQTQLNIVLNNDEVQEFTETFAVKLDTVMSPVGSMFTVSSTDGEATATIFDDEGVLVEVGDASASEGNVLTFTVKMTKTVNADVTVGYKVSSSSADYGTDFEIVGSTDGTGSITIPRGSTEGTIQVPSIDDNIAEKAEQFNIQITGATVPGLDASIIPANSVGTGTIGSSTSFDEDLTVEVTTATAPVTRGSNVEFTVRLSHAVDEAINIVYSTEDGSASSGATHPDFSATAGTARFPSMSTESITVNVPTLVGTCQQEQVNEDFTLRAVASQSEGFYYNSALVATATVAPTNHNPTVSIRDATSNEGIDMVFSVELSHCVTDEVYIAFNSVNGQGSAYPGQNFLLPNIRTVSFQPDSSVPTIAEFSVNIISDDVQGTDKDFVMEIGAANPPNDNAGAYSISFATATATGLIVDDEYATLSVTQCVSQNPSINNQYVFTVALSHAVASTIELTYNTSDITAVAGLDYNAMQGTIQFPQGTTNARELTVTAISRPEVVQPHGSTSVAPPARFGLGLEAPGALQSILDQFKITWAAGDGNTADNVGKGAIKGKENTNLVVKRTTGTEGDSVEFTAIIEDTLSADVTLSYIVSGSDDASTNGLNTITFSKNQPPNQEQKFFIELVDDYVVEPEETYDVVFTVVSPAGFQGTVINFDGVEQQHVISDNDHATLEIRDASGFESNQLDVPSNIVFSVVLSHYTYADVVVDFVPSSACGRIGDACIVDVQPTSQSANADVIFASNAIKTVTFIGGQTTGATPGGHVKEIVFDILNDDILEPTETFTVTATSASTLLGAASVLQATGSIVDDENAYFIVDTVPAAEGTDAVFDVSLSHTTSTSVMVNFATFDSLTSDLYFDSKVGSFSISSVSPQATFFVKTVDNLILDPTDVNFYVNFTSTDPLVSLTENTATGIITEDVESIRLDVNCEPVDENAAQPVLLFATSLLGGATSAPFDVSYTTKDLADEAVAGEDYVATSGSLSFSGNEFQRLSVAVPVLKDNLVEKDELVGFEIEITDQAFKGRIATNTVEGKIIDLEDATLSVRDAVVREAENAEMVFTVFLSHAVGENTNFQLEYNAFNDEADDAAWSTSKLMYSGERAGKDYEAVTGALSERFVSTRSHIRVPVHDDFITELPEFVQLEITNVPESMSLANLLAVGSIIDDDVATVSINSISNHHETVSTVELQVTMSHLTQDAITVSYQTLDGFATSALEPTFFKNVDYQSKSGTVVFPTAFPSVVVPLGDVNTREQTITIEVTDDIIVEEDYEDFCVSLRNIVTPANIGAVISPNARDGFVALRDDAEAATVYVVDVSAQEGETLEFQVVLSHAVQGSDVTVEFTTNDITTTAGEDYATTTGTSLFRASVIDGPKQAEDTILVDTTDDSEEEFDEVFEIQLSNLAVTPGIVGDVPLGEETLSISVECGHGTITDIKGALALGSLSVHDATAAEADGEITFSVTFPRDRDSYDGDVQFNYQTFAGDAFPDRDYTSVAASATIPSDKDEIEISIPLLSNDIVQGDHSFTLLITSNHPVAIAQATGTIADDDTAEISIADSSGFEADGVVEFTVSLDKAVDSDIKFTFVTAGADEDITPVNLGDASGEATVVSGRTEAVFQVEVINDNIQEDDESFTVTASGLIIENSGIPANKVSWIKNEAQGTIEDEEHATVSIAAAVDVDENVGTYLFAVSLSHVIRADNEVVFQIVADTADDLDFQVPRDLNLKFSTRTDVPPQVNIPLEINDDAVAEGHETLEIQLVRSTGSLFLSDESSSVVTIIDDDFATLSIADATGQETEGTLDFVVTLSHEVKGGVEITAQTAMSRTQSNRATGAIENKPQLNQGGVGFVIEQPDFKQDVYTAQVTKGNRNIIEVEVFDDTEQECDETFDIEITQLSCGSGAVCDRVSIAVDSATGTLSDDNEGLSLVGEILEHNEGFGSFDFQITLSHAVSKSFDAEISLLPTANTASRLPACAGKTLTQCQVDTTLTFAIPAQKPSGIISGLTTWNTNFIVAVTDDNTAQPPETFQVEISTNWDAQCGSLTVQNGQGTITDNEGASVSIQSLQANEDGDHPMKVSLSHPIDQELEIGFEVSGPGDLSSDFVSTTGIVQFSASVNSQQATANVDVIAETELEQDEVYTVSLINVPAWLQNNGPAQLTILDDEVQSAIIKASSPRATEGGNLVYTISLEGEHEEQVIVRWKTVNAGTGKAGINFANSNGDLFWAANDNTARTVVINTVEVPGCNSDKTVHLQLFAVAGAATLDNRESTMESAGTITDKNGAIVTLSAPSFVLSSDELALTASLSETCDSDVDVPFAITYSSVSPPTSSFTCRILAGSTSCQAGPGAVGAPTSFTAAISATQFDTANPGFTNLSPSTAVASGTIADEVSGDPPIRVRTGCPIALRSSETEVPTIELMPDPDFSQTHDVASCFEGDGMSFSVSGFAGATITPAGVLTVVGSSVGDSNLFITASNSGGAVSMQFDVSVQSQQSDDIIKLAGEGLEINVGEYYQALLGRVVWTAGNTIDMCAKTNLVGNSLTDCCTHTPDDGLLIETCERNPATRRQVRLESVKVSFKATKVGEFKFCVGNIAPPENQENRYCVSVVVV